MGEHWQKLLFKNLKREPNSKPLVFEILFLLGEEKPSDPVQYIKDWLLSHPAETERLKDQELLNREAEFIYKLSTGEIPFPEYCTRVYKKID